MDQFENTIQKLQDKVFDSNPIVKQITDKFLSDKEIAAKLMQFKNPNLDPADVELMITGKATQLLSKDLGNLNPQALSKQFLNDKFKDLSPPQLVRTDIDNIRSFYSTITKNDDEIVAPIFQQFEINASIINDEIKNNQPVSFKWRGNGNLEIDAKKLKIEVKNALFMVIKEQQELVQDLISFAIQFGNTIAGAAVLVAPLSFNVPAALSLIMTLFQGIRQLISKVLNIVIHLEPLKNLKFLLPDDTYDIIITPIRVTLQTILGIMNSVSTLQGLIGVIAGEMSKQSNPENLKPQKEAIIREIANKRGEQSLFGPEEQEYKSYQSEIDGLIRRLEAMEKPQQSPLPKQDENGNFNLQDLNSLEIDPLIKGSFQTIMENMSTANEVNQNIQGFVYDAYFPDGTIRTDLTEDQIAELKTKYDIQFDPSVSSIIN